MGKRSLAHKWNKLVFTSKLKLIMFHKAVNNHLTHGLWDVISIYYELDCFCNYLLWLCTSPYYVYYECSMNSIVLMWFKWTGIHLLTSNIWGLSSWWDFNGGAFLSNERKSNKPWERIEVILSHPTNIKNEEMTVGFGCRRSKMAKAQFQFHFQMAAFHIGIQRWA